jgi:D-glycero-D-manno-heptose 1,7-bisphosphate phosphatase
MSTPAQILRPAAFLDRDGVLNVDHGYVARIADFAWLPGAVDAIKWLNDRGLLVFVVTNQGGVALGRYTEDDVKILFDYMQGELGARGARIDDYRYSPEHPAGTIARYRTVSDWRKPGPGMILDLMKHWPVDRARSFMLGDKASDMEAAAAAGVAGHLYTGGNVCAVVQRIVEGMR